MVVVDAGKLGENGLDSIEAVVLLVAAHAFICIVMSGAEW